MVGQATNSLTQKKEQKKGREGTCSLLNGNICLFPLSETLVLLDLSLSLNYLINFPCLQFAEHGDFLASMIV